MNAQDVSIIKKTARGKKVKYTVEYQGNTVTVSCDPDHSMMLFMNQNNAHPVSAVVQQLEHYDYSKYKYAPGRDSLADIPMAAETEYTSAKEKFVLLMESISSDTLVKYVVVNAVRKKDGTLYKKRSLPLATFPYTDDYWIYELVAYNKTDMEMEIKLNRREMIYCPNEDEFKILSFDIISPDRIDTLLDMIKSGEIPDSLIKKTAQPETAAKSGPSKKLPFFKEENGKLKKVNFQSADKSAKQYLHTEPSLEKGQKLYRLTVPAFITSIEDEAFYQCTELREICFDGDIQRIGNRAFFGCEHFRGGRLPDSISFIGKQAFLGAHCSGVFAVPQAVSEMEEEVFSGCKMCRMALHSGVKRIKKGAFKNCTELTDSLYGGCFIIPDGVIAIDAEAFAGCVSLKTVKIAATVTEIADDAFKGCPNLQICAPKDSIAQRFALSHNIPFSELEQEFQYSKDKLDAYHGLKTSIIVPGKIKTIGKAAFRDGLQREIVISEGVGKISESAFTGCRLLKKLSLPDSLIEIGAKAFSSCETLEFVRLPHGVKQIGSQAFRFCKQLKEVFVPETIETIGKEAFFCCDSLKKVTICAQNAELGERAVSCNASLVITAPKNSPAERYAREHNLQFEEISG